MLILFVLEMPVRCPISVESFGDITVQDERKGNLMINLNVESMRQIHNLLSNYEFERII